MLSFTPESDTLHLDGAMAHQIMCDMIDHPEEVQDQVLLDAAAYIIGHGAIREHALVDIVR